MSDKKKISRETLTKMKSLSLRRHQFPTIQFDEVKI